ncbi:MAG: hypothetical protein ACLUPK_05055 [Veillonella sp.]
MNLVISGAYGISILKQAYRRNEANKRDVYADTHGPIVEENGSISKRALQEVAVKRTPIVYICRWCF